MRTTVATMILLLAAAGASAQAGRTSGTLIRAQLAQARLALDANQWSGAERALRALDQQLSLDESTAGHRVRIRVEFILWDLRMGLRPRAQSDLTALTSALDALLTERPPPTAGPAAP